ncbi:right-handed parallel beta-helix repeat-containing protein [Sphingomonas sp.]|uniref:right-handed parallel beta-helix repeat-containing protein n=1 Tax=Sphingomonas sp. TaxID=28214 RepID=UPI003D6CBA00
MTCISASNAFGAKGDGVTDDTAALQDWLDHLGSKVGCLAPGVYITGPLTCGPDVTIVGSGLTNSQLKLKNGAAGAILTVTNGTHFTALDIGFDGNRTNCPSGTLGLHLQGAESGGNGFWIEDCGFFNTRSTGFFQEGTYSKARVANCIAEGCGLDGIALNATTTIITGNRCVSNARFGILVQGNWPQITGNTCTNNGQSVTGGAGIGVVFANYAIVSANTCLSNGVTPYFTHGIQLNQCSNGIMTGNFSQGNNGSGLDVFMSPYTTVSGNQSLNNKVRGIEVDTGSTYTTVSGNVVMGNDEVGINVFNTVGAIIDANTVTGNGVLGTAANPVSGETNRPYGIACRGGGSYGNYTRITNNVISGNIGSGSNGVGLFVEAACAGVTLTGNLIRVQTQSAY